MRIAELEPGRRFRIAAVTNEPWNDQIGRPAKEGTLVAVGECGATVKWGQDTRRRVEIIDKLTHEVTAFDVTDPAVSVRISNGTEVDAL